MWLQRERKDDVIWSDLKLGGHFELNAILFQSWSKIRSRSKLTSVIGSNISPSSSHTTLWLLQVNHQHLRTNLQGLLSVICTSWSSVNQISNFKFSGFFRVLFALWTLKYPHPREQQTPRVSTQLEILVNLSFSCIPLQKILQKGVDRLVENPRKRAWIFKWRRTRRTKFYWRMRNKMPLCCMEAFPWLFLLHVWLHLPCQRTIFPALPWLEENLRLWKTKNSGSGWNVAEIRWRVWKPRRY